MAYVKDKGKIIEKMRELAIRCYSLTGPGGKPLYSEQEDETISVERACDLLQADLDSFEGTVEVTLREMSKSTRKNGGITRTNHVFLIRLDAAGSASGGMAPNMFQLMLQLQNEKLSAMKQQFEFEARIAELERKKNKKEEPGAFEKFIMPQLAPYLPQLMNNMGLKPMAGIPMNGLPEAQKMPQNPFTEDELVRVNNCVIELKTLDPDIVSNLENLLLFLKNDAAQYQMISAMLKSSVESYSKK